MNPVVRLTKTTTRRKAFVRLYDDGDAGLPSASISSGWSELRTMFLTLEMRLWICSTKDDDGLIGGIGDVIVPVVSSGLTIQPYGNIFW